MKYETEKRYSRTLSIMNKTFDIFKESEKLARIYSSFNLSSFNRILRPILHEFKYNNLISEFRYWVGCIKCCFGKVIKKYLKSTETCGTIIPKPRSPEH
jgi:hypothetical protein